MPDPKALIDDYLDGTLDDALFEALCRWLNESKSNQRTFLHRIAMHNTIAECDLSQNVGAWRIPWFFAHLIEEYTIDVALSGEAWLIKSVREISIGSTRCNRSARE